MPPPLFEISYTADVRSLGRRAGSLGHPALVDDHGPWSGAAPAPPSIAADFPAVIKLVSLDGTNGFRLDGIDADDRAGASVSSAGDVNGDGFDDIVIGAYRAEPGGHFVRGESYVVFGHAGGFAARLDLASLDGANGFRIDGTPTSNYFGRSVSSAGDVNRDGFDDIIVGAPGFNLGESYVVFGKAGGFAASLDAASLDGTNGFRLDGIDTDDRSGISVSSAGDVNGDGFDDIIIGAPDAESGGDSSTGESYVVFGKAGGFAASIDLSSLNGVNGFRVDGIDANDQSGGSVSSAGDVNDDGFDDIIIGAKFADSGIIRAGESYVVFGKASGFAKKFNLSSLDGTNGFRIDGADVSDDSGSSVSSAGDVNRDGFDDILIGAEDAYPDGVRRAGASYVVFGKAGGFAASIDLATLDGSNGFRLDGAAYGYIGSSVSSAGDVNGDGFDDIIIGAERASAGGDTGAGRSYVVFGKAGGFTPSIELASLDGTNGFRLDGVDEDDSSGHSVSSAGDVNNDGFDDILIGAPHADPGGDGLAGESYLIFGRAPTGAVNRVGSAADQAILGGVFDDTLSGLGGSDTLGGGDGADMLDGGGGGDWADYSKSAAAVHADLTAPGSNLGEAEGDVYISIENLRGSAFNDTLYGDEGANRIEGLAMSDLISGRDGRDALAGGAGSDSLEGGAGNDRFELASLNASDADTILDFVSGEDRIALDGDVFGLNRVKASRYVVGDTAQDSNDRLIYNAGNGMLFFDPDGTGPQGQVLIATLTGAPALSASDFVVI